MADDLFRKSALDKLASPERLDVLMRVTSPKGWAALWAIGGVLVAVVAWSIFGSLPERIEGQGELIRGGGTLRITASGDGVLSKLDLKVDQNVAADQIVGEIRADLADEPVKSAQAALNAQQLETSLGTLDDQAAINSLQQGIRSDQEDVRRISEQLAQKQKELEEKKVFKDQGLITQSRLDQVQSEVNGFISQLSIKRESIRGKQVQIDNLNARTRARNNATDVAKRNAARAVTTKTEISQVKATVPGRVIEIVKREGERVRMGEVVATVEPVSTDMEAVIYVASASGKRIKPSMEVQLSPTTVKREEYGFMKGMVTRVGDYAATPESARAVLGNDALVKEFLEGGSKFELRVLPTVDSKTRSGFAWSSSGGPPEKIGTGTKVTVAVIVDRHRPIVEVLPFLKSMMGSS
jgi:HlyD family secretion protein